ncbi:hypothetical protein ACLOJK_000999 [Asimina triloba]
MRSDRVGGAPFTGGGQAEEATNIDGGLEKAAGNDEGAQYNLRLRSLIKPKQRWSPNRKKRSRRWLRSVANRYCKWALVITIKYEE